ncbi:MAG: hypothetical protein ACERKD_04585 [Prolixibacteraceae bacterium]
MKKLFVFTLTLLAMIVYTSCQYTDIVPDDGSSIVVSNDLSFAVDVEPIFQTQSCTNCHPGMHQPNLTAGNAYTSLMDGDYINEKKPAESSIVVEAAPGATHGATLTAAQVQTIIAWIEQGAKDN